tara:strand:+ start:614 stop:1570 length:957 start_codon:yes stop_codon:yes gene_type:complete
MKSNIEKIQYIELLRFMAALSVVLVHLPTINFGDIGVDLFFIISGFIMMYSTRITVNNFFQKRIFRIIPLYWACTIGLFLIALLYPILLKTTTLDFEQLLKSLFFIPFDKNGTGHFPFLMLGWTLNYEMYFYLIFGICSYLFYNQRDILCSFILIMMIFLFRNSSSFLLSVYGSPIVVEFILGMISYRILYDKKIDLHLLVLSVLVLLPIMYFLPERVLTQGLPMLLVFFISHYALSKKEFPIQITLLGGCSYSLYLTHPYIIRFFVEVVPLFGINRYIDIISTIFALISAIIISIFIYKRFESPMNQKLRGYLKHVK